MMRGSIIKTRNQIWKIGLIRKYRALFCEKVLFSKVLRSSSRVVFYGCPLRSPSKVQGPPRFRVNLKKVLLIIETRLYLENCHFGWVCKQDVY